MKKATFDGIINELQGEAAAFGCPEGYGVRIYTSIKHYDVATGNISIRDEHICLCCVDTNTGDTGYTSAIIPYKEIKLIER